MIHKNVDNKFLLTKFPKLLSKIIINEKFYSNMEEYEKNLIKNNMTALAHDANSYIEMGFPHDKLKFETL